MLNRYLYVLLNLLIIAGPVLASFERALYFRKFWATATCSSLIVAIPFIVWDYFFTQAMAWTFNHEFTLAPVLGGLPPGEILFFISVPFACLFLYAVCKHYDWRVLIPNSYCVLFVLLLTCTALIQIELNYTAFVSALVGISVLVLKRKHYFPYIIATYLLHLPGFLIFNGVLTAIPVVLYNDTENLGLRFTSIPVEDFLYSFALLTANIAVFETVLYYRLGNSRNT